MPKWWTAEDLPKGAIGYSTPYNADPGDLYAVFPDGTYQLLEKGHGARMLEYARTTNEKLYVPGGSAAPPQSSTTSSISATPTTPDTSATVRTTPKDPVKTAPIDTVLFDDNSMSIEIMTDLIFEDIGGHELINIARNDIINGQQVSYTPIKNLGLIQQMYNPNNILGLQATSERYFNNFSIKFEEKVPLVGNGPNGSNVYIEQATGDLIIEGVNINKDELFEVEISLNGTIYIANFGETTS